MSTLKATNLQHNSAVNPNIVLTTSGDVNVMNGILDTTTVEHNPGRTYYSSGVDVFNFQSGTGSSSVQSRITLDGTKAELTGASLKNYFTFISQPLLEDSSTITSFNGYSSTILSSSGGPTYSGTTNGYTAGQTLVTRTLGDVRGYFSNLNTDGTRNIFNFYAPGSAPSLFNGGIQFSTAHSTGGTQEQLQLDYYEEGVWTPIFGSTAGGGSNPTCTYAANGQQGVYTRIGDTVIASCVLILTNVTGGSGVLDVKGLPFPIGQFPTNTAGHGTGGATVNSYSNITQANASYPAVTHIRPRTAAAFQPMSSNGQDTITIGVNRLQNTSVLRAQIVYKVA